MSAEIKKEDVGAASASSAPKAGDAMFEFGVGTDDEGRVVVQFNTLIRHWTMAPNQAVEFAEAVIKAALSANKANAERAAKIITLEAPNVLMPQAPALVMVKR